MSIARLAEQIANLDATGRRELRSAVQVIDKVAGKTKRKRRVTKKKRRTKKRRTKKVTRKATPRKKTKTKAKATAPATKVAPTTKKKAPKKKAPKKDLAGKLAGMTPPVQTNNDEAKTD